MIHIYTTLCTNEGFTLSNKEKFVWTKNLGTLLKMRTNEKPTNENRTNQGPGVLSFLFNIKQKFFFHYKLAITLIQEVGF